jgi:hypothetical protein
MVPGVATAQITAVERHGVGDVTGPGGPNLCYQIRVAVVVSPDVSERDLVAGFEKAFRALGRDSHVRHECAAVRLVPLEH